jgi:hypothetical protein
MNSDDKEFLQWLIQFVPEQQNMKLHALELSKAVVQFKKCAWEEAIQSGLVFDLEPTLMDSAKKVVVEKTVVEVEAPREEEEEAPLTPEIQEIVCFFILYFFSLLVCSFVYFPSFSFCLVSSLLVFISFCHRVC